MNKEQERERIGQRIADLRKEKGMTQQGLADIVGMQRNHISRIEAGKYSVGFDTLQAIAEALGGTIDIIDPRLSGLAPMKTLTEPMKGSLGTALNKKVTEVFTLKDTDKE